MSSQPAAVGEQSAGTAPTDGGHEGSHRLGWFLCWAVVFADLGTSVYYTPGILYGQVGSLAGLFVTMTLVVFLLLTLKYAEVSVRFPEGGGVVTVAARGLNPWAGAVGGMFILVDYFLTSAISSLSGLQYFTDIVPGIAPIVLPLTVGVVAALGVLNWWGIKESAIVSAVIAVAAVLSDAAILILVLVHVPLATIIGLFGKMFQDEHLGPALLLTGYAGAFLAFSGLESISQLAPVMRVPRRKTVRAALVFVVITVGVSSPLLTIFSTTLLNVAQTDPNKFVSQLGGAYGGDALKVVTAISASALLVFASNTAIIGAYHVFLALSRMQFFPHVIEQRNKWRGTPHIAIAVATGIPILVLIAVQGRIDLLGDMYAFGLLGAFSLTCIALDAIRIRERRAGTVFSAAAEDEVHALVARAQGHEDEGEFPPEFASWVQRASQRDFTEQELEDLTNRLAREHRAARDRRNPVKNLYHRMWPHAKYYLGFITTFLVSLAWVTNLFAKPLATMFGGALTIIGVTVAVMNYRHQVAAGLKPVFPERRLRPVPGALLVVLPSGSPENRDVVRAAVASANGRPLAFLGLGSPYEPESRTLMQITDAYFHDDDMKRTFGLAEALCNQAGITPVYFYLMKTPVSVALAWRVTQADAVIGEAELAHDLPGAFASADYIRKQPRSDVRTALRHHHHPYEESHPSRGAEQEEAPPTPVEPAAGESSPRFKKVLNPNRITQRPDLPPGIHRRTPPPVPREEPTTADDARPTDAEATAQSQPVPPVAGQSTPPTAPETTPPVGDTTSPQAPQAPSALGDQGAQPPDETGAPREMVAPLDATNAPPEAPTSAAVGHGADPDARDANEHAHGENGSTPPARKARRRSQNRDGGGGRGNSGPGQARQRAQRTRK